MVAEYLGSEGPTGCLDLGDLALLQALLYLPSLDIWRTRKVCRQWNRLSSNQGCAFTLWRHFGAEPLGLIAEGAVWLHAITALPRVSEALKLLQGCLVLGASWLCPVGVERLLAALVRIERPWNMLHRPSKSRNIVKSWTLGFPQSWRHPETVLSDVLQLGDLFGLNDKWLAHFVSEPLTVVAGDLTLCINLSIAFRHAGECTLFWTASCSKDMFDNDVEVELSGGLVSPCQAEIRPFGICNQHEDRYVVDDLGHGLILQALMHRAEFVCVLWVVFKHLGAEYAVTIDQSNLTSKIQVATKA